jgi:hypothetical protein
MSIHVTQNLGPLAIKKPFPKLMVLVNSDGEIENELVVIFKRFSEGTIINVDPSSEDWNIGDYSSGWHMTSFRDYQGEITLRNN